MVTDKASKRQVEILVHRKLTVATKKFLSLVLHLSELSFIPSLSHTEMLNILLVRVLRHFAVFLPVSGSVIKIRGRTCTVLVSTSWLGGK